jgi:DNA-binding NtrC family response regulator
MERLVAYYWPGNVRELENAIERAVILNRGAQITLDSLPLALRHGSVPPRSATVSETFSEARERFERRYLQDVFSVAGGNLSAAAKQAGMDRSNFRRLIKRYNLPASPGDSPKLEPERDDD